MKKITVIIPVYNGQEYIHRCVDSVLEQENFDVRDLEILLLNDGSKDGTERIINSYADRYPGVVKALSHTNIGVARTRNKGIDIALGEYIIFVDQDDYIDSDYCATMYSAISAEDLDIVICGKKRPDETGKIISRDDYKDANFTKFMSVSVWAKIHRAEFLHREKIRIFNNHQGEDIVFSFEEAQKTTKIKTIKYCGYNWFFNTSSVSNSTQRGLDVQNLHSILNVQNALIRLDELRTKESEYFIYMMSAYYIFFAGRASTSQQLLTACNDLMNNFKTAYPNYLKNYHIIFPPKGTLLIFAIGVPVFTVLHRLQLMKLFARLYCRR